MYPYNILKKIKTKIKWRTGKGKKYPELQNCQGGKKRKKEKENLSKRGNTKIYDSHEIQINLIKMRLDLRESRVAA